MTEKVTKLALASRLIVLTLQLLANAALPDHKPDVFRAPMVAAAAAGNATSPTWLDRTVQACFGGMRHWDGEYFLHIAEHSYTYENTLAFYPLYPLLIRTGGHLLHQLCGGAAILSLRSAILLVAVAVNVALFCHAANVLYTLTQRFFNDPNKSWNATLLFCFNPAAVFFSAAYSETLFAVLTLQLMLDCATAPTGGASGHQHALRATRIAAMLALSTVTRSNGLLNAGFPVYYTVRRLLLLAPAESWRRYLLPLIQLAVCLVAALVPLTFFNFYAFRSFCGTTTTASEQPAEIVAYGRERGYLLAGSLPRAPNQSPWCDAALPLPYGYVQRHYWDVGFLRYYRLRQLPHFALAAPVLAFLAHHCVAQLRQVWATARRLKGQAVGATTTRHAQLVAVLREHKTLPFVLHAACLTLVCGLFVHVQVSTRLLCAATPTLYWFAADHMPRTLDQLQARSKGAAIVLWFGGYGLLGCLLFSNNYPWT